MRTARISLLGLLALALAGPASAASTAQGASILAIQLSRGVADLVTAPSASGITWFNSPESGIQAQYWYFLREDYGLSLTTGIGYFKRSDSFPSGLGGSFDRLTVNSWQFRLGGDRFAKVSDKLQIFVGPGIQYWAGKFKSEDSFGETEGPTTSRWSLSGRFGAHIAMGQNFGLTGQLGQYWGYVSVEESGSKTKVIPSGTEGAMGFWFGF